ncbi:alanine racemase [Mycoplasmatota bacterium]|nr:alanine racemase [Mycoplasmatota bacterium]
MNQYCDTYIKVSRDALTHNAQFFKQISQKKLIAVIKSNAYGHGLLEVANVLEKEADLFAVASLDSAVTLRQAGIKIPILVLNPLNPEYVHQAVKNDLMVTVSNIQDVMNVHDKLKDTDKIVKVHLKIDSGMNRMGLKTKDAYQEVLSFISKSDHIKAIGVYTHFHTPGNKDYSQKQQDVFKDIFHSMPYSFEYVHLCSTNATLNSWDLEESTHVRIGLGLYGLCESSGVIPALSMYSTIMIKKEVLPNEIVGYNANFEADKNTWIGVLPCGYSDGIIRSNVGRKVYVDGHYCEVIGSVCMNSMMVKLPHNSLNHEVQLIGPHVNAIDIAKYLDTISYEVTTILPPHIKRIVI